MAMELTILGHVLFPRNLESIDTGLLGSLQQIEKGYTFVLVLLADIFRALKCEDNMSTISRVMRLALTNLAP